MAVLGLVVHHERGEAVDIAVDAIEWLTERGHEVRLPHKDAELCGHPELGASIDEFVVGLDAAVSLGGDGTMLRTVDMVAVHQIPVVGVNVGHLGYLASVEPSAMRMALKRFLAGSYEVEERVMVSVRVASASGAISDIALQALNEAVVEKTGTGHTVRLEVSIDGDVFTTYAADGLIVATPTGSTAYSMSARGPIVSPTHRALLLTPVSPHMLFDRSLVLSPEETVRIAVIEHPPAALVVDGRVIGELRDGDAIECAVSDDVARLIRFGPRNFHRILKAKFGLSDR